jgi:hypothetical protein
VPDIIDAIDSRIDRRVKDPFIEGVIVNVGPQLCRVRPRNSQTSYEAYYQPGVGVETNKSCLIAWVKERGKYVVVTVFSVPGSPSYSSKPATSYEFAPPSNIRILTTIPGHLVVAWDVPPQQPATFEVQTNTSAADAGATTVAVTRGAYAIVAAAALTYARVRSVSDAFEYSTWSDWYSATPVSSPLTVSEVDGSPSITTSTLRFPNASVANPSAGVAEITFPGSLIVKDIDGSPSVSGVGEIQVTNGALTDLGSGVVKIETGGGDPGVCDGRLTLEPSVPADAWSGTWDFATQGMPSGWSILCGSNAPGSGILRGYGSPHGYQVNIQAPAGCTLTSVSATIVVVTTRYVAAYGPVFGYVDGVFYPSVTFTVPSCSVAGATLDFTQGGSSSDFWLTSMTISGTGTSPFPPPPDSLYTITPAPAVDKTGTEIYFVPYKGSKIGLYDGTAWKMYSFTERVLSLSGCTANTNYDVFAYLSSGVVTLERLAWASDVARAIPVASTNGIYVKGTDLTRRYLGTFRTTSAGTTEDSKTKRFVWNYYNRLPRELRKLAVPPTWAYTTAAWRVWNADATNMVEIVTGFREDAIELTLQARGEDNDNGIGENLMGALAVGSTQATNATGALVTTSASLRSMPRLGYSYYAMIEYGGATFLNEGYALWGLVGRFWA